MKSKKIFSISLAALFLFIFNLKDATAADGAGVYGGGPFYYDRHYAIDHMRQSGFKWVCIWTIHVMNTSGDLNFNAEFPLVEDGNYIGNNSFPNFASDVAAMKTQPTSVEWVEFGLSAWGSSTFDHIRTIVNSQGTGPGSPLYENFKALKEAIPAVDAISFDDESTYDASTATQFAVMLADLGYKVSICPYTRVSFWQSLVSNTNSQRPGTIEDVHVQCYAGGSGNNPCTWEGYFASNINVMPGVEDGSSIGSKMSNWDNQCTIYGGWIWLYDDFKNNLSLTKQYAAAINNNVSSPPNNDPPDPATNPTPSNGSGNVNINQNLSWSAGSGATSHDVYFGTDATPDNGEFQGNQSGTSFDPGTLSYSTTYYWRIDEVNSHGTTTGSVWNFTTQDPVTCLTLPYSESFESGIGDFTQASGDDGDWTRHSGSTASSNTGPSGAAAGSYYMYIEASTSGVSYPDNVANLDSRCFNLSGASNPTLTFQYHMYGAAMGTLNVRVSTNSGSSWTTEWTVSGDQGNSWHDATVDLSSYAGQPDVTIRFNGITGSNYTSDICIDDVELAEGTTPDPPVADFSANVTTVTEGGSVNFTDNSTNNPTSWSWSFEGGSPSSSSSQNPTVTYNTAGTYDVTLTATNAGGSDGETKTNYITVNPAGGDDYAPLPYSTGFESGSIDQYWTLETENSYGRIQVSSGNSPNGSYHLISDVTTDGNYSTNAGLLHVDLAGYTTVDLSFVWKEFSDEDNTEDGVFLSDDGGSNFTKVYNLTGGSSSYAQVNLDIDQLASSNGLSLSSTFIIKFQHRDNYTLTTDGMAWDDISVTGSGGSDPPDPATNPTPADGTTGVSLSATLSWSAGAGATSHDVYFGTDATPDAGEAQGNQSGTTFDPGALSANTTYYWRIDEVNTNGTTTGSVWSFTTGDGSSYATVGITDVYGSTSTNGSRRAMPFSMPEDGTIESISMYHTGGSGDMILAVYEGASEPTNRLGITPTTAVSGSTDWQTINLTNPVSVSSGTQIWLAWVYESNPGIRYQSGSPGRYQSSESWSGGMPDPFGGGSQGNYLYSIYATYSTGKSKAVEFNNSMAHSDGINIYPNPVNDALTIVSKAEGISTVHIIDMRGRLVYQDAFAGKLVINTSESIRSGIYLVKVITTDDIYTEKLMVK